MNTLRWIKLSLLLGIPFLAVLYAYQFTGQLREEIVPFKPFKAEFLKVYDPAQSLTEPVELPLRGNLILLNLWATWCPPCVEEFPAMLELQRRLEDQGVEIVFVSVDERWEDVAAFFATHGLDVASGRLFWGPQKRAGSGLGDRAISRVVCCSPRWLGWWNELLVFSSGPALRLLLILSSWQNARPEKTELFWNLSA
jgi:thiol-disulfide isomerase/thioredoxin